MASVDSFTKTLMMNDSKQFSFSYYSSEYSPFMIKNVWFKASTLDFKLINGFTLVLKSYLQHFPLSNFSYPFSKNLAADCPISTFFNYNKGRIFSRILGRHSYIKTGNIYKHLFRDANELSKSPGFFSSKWSKAIPIYFLALLFDSN